MDGAQKRQDPSDILAWKLSIHPLLVMASGTGAPKLVLSNLPLAGTQTVQIASPLCQFSTRRMAGIPALYVCLLPHNCRPCLQATLPCISTLQALPPSITALGSSLLSLDVAHNQLAALPPGFLESMTKLQELRLAHNHLCMCIQVHGFMAVRARYDKNQVRTPFFQRTGQPGCLQARLLSNLFMHSRL